MNIKLVKHALLRVCLSFLLIIIVTTFGVVTFAENNNGGTIIEVTLDDNKLSKSDKDIKFTPEIGKKYEFTATITNSGNEVMDVKVYPSIAVSNEGTIQYLEETPNTLNEFYNLRNYTKIYLGEKEINNKSIQVKPNSSQQVRIKIEVPPQVKGEILGVINFSQILDNQENIDSLDVIQVYEKVIGVRLKMTEFEEKKPNTYNDFEFSSTKDATTLAYFLYNNNPFLNYADKGNYQLINPNEKVISEGEFKTSETVLTPLTKTKLSVPLKDNIEIIEGKYKFVTLVNGIEKIFPFEYTKEKLEEFADKNKDKNNVVVNVGGESSTIIMVIIFIIVANALGILIYIKKKG